MSANHTRRVEALENANGHHLRKWHRLIVQVGERYEDVRARYEAAKGPIGEGHGVIVRRCVGLA